MHHQEALMRVAARSLFFGIMLTLTVLAPALAGDDGEVTFRLTLRGTPVPTDTFTLAVNASDGTVVSPGILCGPTEPNSDETQVCEDRSYDFTATVAVGTELEYVFARDQHYDGSADGAEILLTGTVAVTDDPQVVTLVYDYALGSAPGPLPDTSSGVSGGAAPSGVPMVLSGFVLLAGAVALVRRERARQLPTPRVRSSRIPPSPATATSGSSRAASRAVG